MTFEEFCKPIHDQIKVPAIMHLGTLGSGYYHILVADNGAVKSIGEFVGTAWNNYHYEFTEELRMEFGKEAEKYRTGLREKMPCVCFVLNGDDQYELKIS